MSLELTAIYENGVFTPTTDVDLPERTQVELVVLKGTPSPDSNQKKRVEALERLFARIEANPLKGDYRIFTREELHDRD